VLSVPEDIFFEAEKYQLGYAIGIAEFAQKVKYIVAFAH